MKKKFTLHQPCCSSIAQWQLNLLLFLFVFTSQFFVVAPATAQGCTPISTLTCDRVTVPLPVNLTFNSGESGTIADKNGLGTGFTMVDAYSGTRLSADGSPSNSTVPGYEASKLTVTGGRLQVVTNKGIAYLTNNNQLNALGVKVDSRSKLTVEVTLVNPYYGTSSQQGGLWLGLNDKSFLKLVVTANKVELRKEHNDASSTSDQRLTGTISGLNTTSVRLRLVVDPATNSAQGFYSTNGGTSYLSVGTALSISGMGLTSTTAYAGIFATHRNATSSVTYSFDDFSVTGDTSSGNEFSTISWGTAAAYPFSANELQGEVVNGKLYTFGGYYVNPTTGSWTPRSQAFVYDPTLNKWTSIASMPPMNGTNYGGVTHAGFATDGKDVYFAGGYTSNSTGTGQIFGTKEAWKYIVAENRYVRLPDLPKIISSGQLEYINGRLHHIGGHNQSRSTDLGDHYVLDLSNMDAGWKTLAALPNPSNHAASAVYEGKIYYVGGQKSYDGNSVTQKSLYIYNPGTNSWTKGADMPVPSGANGRSHISSSIFVMGSRILVLGGDTSHGSNTNLVSAYTPASNSWESLTPLPIKVRGGVAAVLGGNIYYTAGSNSSATTYKGVPEGTQTQQQQVTSFTLFDAGTKKAIQTLTSGSTLNLSTLPSKNLNIRANTSPSTVGSVVFVLSGTQSKSVTESAAPYDLMGDNGAWTPAVGSYTLKATPYTASKGGGTAGTALTVAFSVTEQAGSTGLISNITTTTGKSYTLADLATGVKPYTDRAYLVTSVPSSLAGSTLIQTANDDKWNTSASMLTFKLSQSATIYIAYDPRATALPSWLSGWQKLTDRIGVNDSKISYMDLYSKSFDAGTVSLGGNMQSPAAGAQNNFFVVAKAAAQGTNSTVLDSPDFTEAGEVEMLVYPNPNTGDRIYLQVNNLKTYEAVTVTMQDMLGRSITSLDLTTDAFGSARAEVPRGNLISKGLYIIKASAASGKVQSKLLIE
jgi:N-acetylneuraminic acid mutarotase